MKLGWLSIFMEYVWPPSVISKLFALFIEWQRCDAKNKTILTLFFIPALLCVGGLVFQVAHFILFHLPAFIMGVLGWLLLISLFSGGGLFCYEKMNSKRAPHNQASDFYDVTPDDEEPVKDKKSWFSDVKWFKK